MVGMALRIWMHEQNQRGTGYAAALKTALTQAGLEVVNRKSEGDSCGVVLFSQASPELLAAVQDLSRHGLDRLVAVSVGDEQVTGAIAWPLRRAGACDVVGGRDTNQTAQVMVSRATRWSAVDEMMGSASVAATLVGRSPAWVLALRQIVEAASFTDGSLLLLGESGTGKELVARMVHALDRRPGKKSLVVLDCTTVVPDLAGSEFFGHERGAFTGASSARDGSFALADGGTLFLDEVGELPLPLQAQLLRVVQEHTYKRVGSNDWQRANFRLIAATNRNLDDDVAGGGFRRDLFHRIASRVYRIPPLRSRSEDILPLAQHFLAQMRPGEPTVVLDPAVREYLINRPYPGNVRELRQVVCRMADRHVGDGPVTVGAIPPDEVPSATAEIAWRSLDLDQGIWKALEFGVGLHEIKEAASARAFALALEMEAGSTRAAAQRLAVTERAVQMYRADCRSSAA
jgi:transcriptional regulator with GAF, ATPase, and Fis domain